MLITILLTIMILSGLCYVFLRLKTPYYRVDHERMIRVLEMVITGQATDNDWNMTMSMVIRHSPELEAIRERCVDIEEHHYIGDQKPPYLFSQEGLDALKPILDEVRQDQQQSQ